MRSRLDGFLFGMGGWDGGRRFGIDVDYGDRGDGSEKGLSDGEQEIGVMGKREVSQGGNGEDKERGLYHAHG